MVDGVQLKDTLIGKDVPKLCAVGNTGSFMVNPLICASALFKNAATNKIVIKNLKYLLICFMIISFKSVLVIALFFPVHSI